MVRRGGIILCGALIIAYIYFASASVFHAIMQRTAEGNIETARTELATLEKNYFSLSKHVDQNAAAGLNLVKASQKSFAERSVHVGVVSATNGL